MKCPHCHAENEASENFCGDCGTALASAVAPSCPKCGSKTIPDTSFCMD
ncbi:MAG: zinc-ribbon domain-containing protein [Chloroflexi bacterium]|nr:zinc-ribbon domain-containing protein [Chloroflexota bacterium]